MFCKLVYSYLVENITSVDHLKSFVSILIVFKVISKPLLRVLPILVVTPPKPETIGNWRSISRSFVFCK